MLWYFLKQGSFCACSEKQRARFHTLDEMTSSFGFFRVHQCEKILILKYAPFCCWFNISIVVFVQTDLVLGVSEVVHKPGYKLSVHCIVDKVFAFSSTAIESSCIRASGVLSSTSSWKNLAPKVEESPDIVRLTRFCLLVRVVSD